MTVPININEASIHELLMLPGLPKALALRIVEYRARVGRFRALADLLSILGFSEGMLTLLRDKLSLGETDRPPSAPRLARAGAESDGRRGPDLSSTKLDVVLEGGGGVIGVRAPFAGHRVTAVYSRRTTIPGSAQPLWVEGQVSAEVGVGGSALLSLPNRASLGKSVTLRVLAPDGEELTRMTLATADLPPRVTLRGRPIRSFPAYRR
jgi:hypothetical protein